ncbi:hypothetical protein BH10CHL1_BH10CHL1_45160 [soil metagenome]
MKKRTDYVEISRAILEELYYGQGLKQREIALQFGVSSKTIGNRMAEYGMTTRSHADSLYIDIPKRALAHLSILDTLTAP